MAAENDDLLIKIQADVASATQGLTQTNQGLQQLSDQFSNLLNVVSEINRQFGDFTTTTDKTARGLGTLKDAADESTSGFSSLQAAVVTANAALGLFNQVTGLVERGLGAVSSVTIGAAEQFGQLAQHLQNASQIVGVSSQFYQELQARLERLGLGADSAQQAMIFFSRSLAEAREGNTALSLTFQRLGVDIERSRGTEAIFRDTAKAIAGMTDASARTRVELELFFRSGARMTPVLMAMAQAGEDSAQVMQRLGITMGDDAVNAGKKFQDQYLFLTQIIEAFFRQIGSAEAEAFEPFIRTLTTATGAVSAFATAHRDAMVTLTKAFTILGAAVTTFVAWRIATIAATAAMAAFEAAVGALAFGAGPLVVIFEAMATGGLSLIPAALAAAATAAVLYRDKLSDLVTEVEALGKTHLPDWLLAMVEVGKGALGPQVGRPGNLPGNLAVGSAVESQTAAQEFTPDQLKKVQKSQEELQKVLDAEAVKAVERSKGRAAAIEEQRTREIAAINLRYEQERAAVQKQAGSTPLSAAETKQYATQQQAEIDAANAKARSESAQVGFEQSQAISEQQIKAAQDTARGLVQIEQDKNKTLFEAHKIGLDQYLQTERDDANKLYDIDKTAIQQRLQLASTATDPAKRAKELTDLEALNAQHQKKLTDIDDEGIKDREKLADEQAKAMEQIAVVEQEAYGTPQIKRLAELAKAHEELVKKLQDSGLTQYIHDVDDAYAAMADKVKFGSIAIGDTIAKGLEQTFAGITAGTGKLEDTFKHLGDSILGSFTQWMTKSLEGKLGFDTELQGNFFTTIPGYASTGASKIGSTFSNLFNWLKGGTGTGPSVSVNENSASSTGSGIFNQVGSILFGPPAGGAAPLTSAAGVDIGSVTQSLGTGGEAPLLGAGATPALGEGGIASLGADAGGGAGAAGGAGALGAVAGVAGIAVVVAQTVASAIENVQAANTKLINSISFTHFITAGEKQSADLSAAFSALPLIGQLGGKAAGHGIGKNLAFAALDPIFPGLSWIIPKILELAISVPTIGTQIAISLSKLYDKTQVPQDFGLSIGGHTGIRIGWLGDATGNDVVDMWKNLGFDFKGINQTIQGVAKSGGPQGSSQLAAQLTAAAAARPDVAALQFTGALGLGVGLSAVRGMAAESFRIAEAVTHEMLLTGVSLKEAQREMLELAQAGNVQLIPTLEKINRAVIEHPQKNPLTQTQTEVKAVVDLFQFDLPKAIDASAIAMTAFTDKGTIDIQKFQDELTIAGNLVQGMNLSGAVGAALGTGNAGSFTTTLKQNWGTAVTKTLTDAIAGGAGLGSLFAPAVTDISTAAEAFSTGDTAAATAALQAAGDSMANAYTQGQTFIQQLMTASPALAKMVQDAQNFQDSVTMLGQALSTALSPLTDPNTQIERDAQTQRIADLEYAIGRAKAFGDEITASQLQMQLATEQAAQAAAGGSNTAALFMAQVRQGVKQKVIDDLVNALITSNGGILSSFMDIVAKQTLDMAANPANIATDMANIANAWKTTSPNLSAIMDNIAQFAPLISNSFASGGTVPGPMGMPSLAIVHGGEQVLTAAQAHSYTSIAGPSVQIVVTGNTLMNARDLQDLATMTGDVVLRQLKQNYPISHGRR